MKVKKMSAAFMALLVLFSCSKDDYKDNDKDPDVTETTSLKITFSVGEADTKAVTFPGSASTETEKRIYNAVAVAFDNRGLLEATAEYNEYRDGGTEPSGMEITFEEISTGAHQFYVLANANKDILARKNELFPKGMTVTQFKQDIHTIGSVNEIIREKITYNAAEDNDETTRGFLMSSETGIDKVLTVDGNNEIHVTLIRSVAKVSVAFDPTTQEFGKLQDVQYKVVNNPATLYLFPVIENGIVMTPLFNEAYNESNYVEAAHDYKNAITAATTDEAKTYTYCTENSNMAELQGNSTMILIKGKFVPETLIDDDQAAADGTFWRIYNKNTDIWTPEYYAVEPTGLGIGEEAVEFAKGICYYHAWLKNSSSDRYMVKRNTYVKVTISAVYGAGEPDENGGIDPEKPIEESTSANITVKVLDWDEDDQTITI